MTSHIGSEKLQMHSVQDNTNTEGASECHFPQGLPHPIGSKQSPAPRGRKTKPRTPGRRQLAQEFNLSPTVVIQILITVLLTTLCMHITRLAPKTVIRSYSKPLPDGQLQALRELQSLVRKFEREPVTKTVTTTATVIETKTEIASYPTITNGCNCVPFHVRPEPGLGYDTQGCPECPGDYSTDDGQVHYIPVKLFT